IEAADKVEACDGPIVEVDRRKLVSVGCSKRTPVHSAPELDEEELYGRVARLADDAGDMERFIFNLHVPPYDSTLDTAAELTENLDVVMSGSAPTMIARGSTAVRELIEKYQPLLSLHGHVHESPGATRIGR